MFRILLLAALIIFQSRIALADQQPDPNQNQQNQNQNQNQQNQSAQPNQSNQNPQATPAQQLNQERKDEDLALAFAKGGKPETVDQRLNDIDRVLRNFQQQLDRLSSTVEDNRRNLEAVDQNENNLTRDYSYMHHDIDDMKSKLEDLARRLGR